MSRPLASAKLRHAAGHLSSQALSRLTNLLVSIGIARAASPDEFGAVSLVLILYGTVVSINGMSLGPLAALHADRREASHRQADLLGAALLLWTPVGLLGLAIALLASGDVAEALLPVSIALPFLVLHDTLRFVAFAQRRPWFAAWLDAAWLGVLGALVLSGLARDALLQSWCAAAALVVVVALARSRLWPDPGAGAALLRRERARLAHLGADGLLVASGTHLVVAVSTPFIGLAELAAVRGAQVLAGPLGVVHTALGVALLPRAAAMLDRGQDAGRRIAAPVVLGTCLTLAAAALSMAVPDGVGTALLGDTWPGARAFLPIVLVGMAAQLAALHGQTLLRCRPDGGRRLVNARLAGTLAVVACGLTGLFLHGATGFVLGLTVGRVLSVPLWHVAARSAPAGSVPRPADG